MKKIAVSLVSSVALFLFGYGSCYASENAALLNPKVTTVAVGINPAGIVVSPDNRFVYVANNDSVMPAATNGSSIVTTRALRDIFQTNSPARAI
jgi:DNA-binding beta-propeller fold protein YncE